MSEILQVSKGQKVLVPQGKKWLEAVVVSNDAFWKKGQYRCEIEITWVDLGEKEHTTLLTVPINKLEARQ